MKMKIKMVFESLLHFIGYYRKLKVVNPEVKAMCKVAVQNHIKWNDPLIDYRVFRIGQYMFYKVGNSFYYNGDQL